MPKAVGIVPHTHWDREWYAPFQRYRVQLVHLVDDLLDLLEGDPSFTRFLLDGQTAVLDDYLAVRPEAEPRLRALAGAGRLQVGPWMILMDEFMVSGETMIRNLQHGLARSDGVGRRGGDAASATSPTCSVTSRRCPSCCASPASSTRSCGAACRRRSTRPRSGGARPTARPCAPSTSSVRTRTGATSRRTRRSSWPAPAATTPSSARPRSRVATCSS